MPAQFCIIAKKTLDSLRRLWFNTISNNERTYIMHSLVNVFSTVEDGEVISIDTLTLVPLSGPHRGRVTKRTTGSLVKVFKDINTSSYAKIVENRLRSEGKDPTNFVLHHRTWGQRIPNTPLIKYDNKLYLEVIFLQAGTVEYFLDGAPIDKADIIGMKTPTEAHQGGLDAKVIVRDYLVENVISIRTSRKLYIGSFAI